MIVGSKQKSATCDRNHHPQFCARALVYASDVSVTEWSTANLVVAAHRYRRLRDGAELGAVTPHGVQDHGEHSSAIDLHHPPSRLRHLATASRRRSVGPRRWLVCATRWTRSLPCDSRTREQSFECIMAVRRRGRWTRHEKWPSPGGYCVMGANVDAPFL